MGEHKALVLIFDISRIRELVDYVSKFTSAEYAGMLELPVDDAASILTAHTSSTEPARYHGLSNISFKADLYFEIDMAVRRYMETMIPTISRFITPPMVEKWKNELARIQTESETKNIYQIGGIDLVIYMDSRYVQLNLDSFSYSLDSVYYESSSVRNWAIHLLDKFNGAVGAIDFEHYPGTLFYLNGPVREAETGPFLAFGHPDSSVLYLSEGDVPNPANDAWRAELKNMSQGKEEWNNTRYKLHRMREKNELSAVLVFDRSKAWDILRYLNGVIDHGDGNEIDIRISDRPGFELKEMEFNLTLFFDVDDTILKWWQRERKSLLGSEPPASVRKTVERIDERIRAHNQYPVEDIELKLKFDKENVMLVFHTGHSTKNLYPESSACVRKRFIDLLDRFGGYAGGFKSRGEDRLFYLNGKEMQNGFEVYLDTHSPAQLIERIKKDTLKNHSRWPWQRG